MTTDLPPDVRDRASEHARTDPLPVHEREVRAYAADSGDVVLRRHLTAVLAEYDAMREELVSERHAFKMLNIEHQAALEKITELCAELKGKT